MSGTPPRLGAPLGLSDTSPLGTIDAAWRPWLRLLDAALLEAEDTSWRTAVPSIAWPRAADAPLLDDTHVALDGRRVHRYYRALAREIALTRRAGVPPLMLLHAVLARDTAALERLAREHGAPVDTLAVLGHCAALPLRLACAAAWHDQVPLAWTAGYCPICGGWPALAELRGLERSRYLRCGSCAAEWGAPVLRCPYCGERDHERLGALVLQEDDARWQVDVCETCKGYVKTINVLRAAPARALALDDLASVPLDLAAQARGYARPAEPAVRLMVTLEARRHTRWHLGGAAS